MERRVLVFFCLLLSLVGLVSGANYDLDIINVDEVGADNRIRFAYPGIEYKVVIAAFGGTYPFDWELLEAPSGMVIDSSSGVISWSSPSSGGNVRVRVTDVEGNSDTESYDVVVTDSVDRFVWMDASSGAGGDGSYSNPYRNFIDWYVEGSGSHGGKIMYLREGTYDFEGIAGINKRGHGSYAVDFRDSYHPIAYLGYPGEDVYWSGSQGFNGVDSGKFFDWVPSRADDVYYQGLNFIEAYGYAVEPQGGDYITFFDNHFEGLRAYGGYQNDAWIFFRDGDYSQNSVIVGNTFEDGSNTYASGLKLYCVNYLVVENNIFDNFPDSGINIKSKIQYVAVRNNRISNINNGINIGDSTPAISDVEISFNYIHDNSYTGIYKNKAYGAGVHYFFRNTIVDPFYFREIPATPVTGPFYISNNVIVNSDPDDHIRDSEHYSIEATRTVLDDNLMGFPSDNLVDSNGNLVDRSLVGTYGWEVGEGGQVAICQDGETRSCSTGLLGVCQEGIQTCVSEDWGSCQQVNQAEVEICNNGIDEDCDGGDLTGNWDCSEEGECVDGQAARTCVDLNSCGSDEGKPSEIVSCGFEVEAVVDVDSIYEDYTTVPIDDGVIDAYGDTSTTWASELTDQPHWILLEFSEEVEVDFVEIYWAYNSYLGKFMSSQEVRVQYWDGSGYVDASVIENSEAVESSNVSFSGASSSRIRLYQPANMGEVDYPGVMWVTEVDYDFAAEASCEVVELGDVGLKIEEWKSGEASIDEVLDVVEAWKGGC